MGYLFFFGDILSHVRGGGRGCPDVAPGDFDTQSAKVRITIPLMMSAANETPMERPKIIQATEISLSPP